MKVVLNIQPSSVTKLLLYIYLHFFALFEDCSFVVTTAPLQRQQNTMERIVANHNLPPLKAKRASRWPAFSASRQQIPAGLQATFDYYKVNEKKWRSLKQKFLRYLMAQRQSLEAAPSPKTVSAPPAPRHEIIFT